MESLKEDNRPLVKNPRDEGLRVTLDCEREVRGARCDGGFIFVFTSHGVDTPIALSEDALLAAMAIVEQLLALEKDGT